MKTHQMSKKRIAHLKITPFLRQGSPKLVKTIQKHAQGENVKINENREITSTAGTDEIHPSKKNQPERAVGARLACEKMPVYIRLVRG